jgi:RNA 2',3'-cyclic 3'-phosphodiesterase
MTLSMTARSFIAMELPPSIQQAIAKETARLREVLTEKWIRWIPVEHMHLTLKFLGDVPGSHMGFLKQSLTQIADSSQAFDLQISGLGSFPNSKLPRLLWVGVHAQAALQTIQQNIENAMNRLGYKKEERPFSPHLTLARVRQNIPPADSLKIRDALQTIQLGKIGTARVNSVHLFKSDLTPAGSEYTKLFSANFKL